MLGKYISPKWMRHGILSSRRINPMEVQNQRIPNGRVQSMHLLRLLPTLTGVSVNKYTVLFCAQVFTRIGLNHVDSQRILAPLSYKLKAIWLYQTTLRLIV